MWWEGELILVIKVMSCGDKNRKALALKQSPKRQITETQILSDESEFTQRKIVAVCMSIWDIAPFLLIPPYFICYDK